MRCKEVERIPYAYSIYLTPVQKSTDGLLAAVYVVPEVQLYAYLNQETVWKILASAMVGLDAPQKQRAQTLF